MDDCERSPTPEAERFETELLTNRRVDCSD
jgi:hypothetical protein